MILGRRPDLAGLAARVRSFQTQGWAVLRGTLAEAEWAPAWGSWEARGGQVVVSPEGGHHSDPRPMPDRTTSSDLEDCLALEAVVGGVLGEEGQGSPPVAPLSSICHQTLVLLCTPDPGSIPCCLQGVWEARGEEGGHPTLALEYLRNSSTDKEDTHSTARHYLVAAVPEGPRMVLCLRWEGPWVLG